MKEINSRMTLNKEIDSLRQKLYSILDSQELSSDEVLRVSQTLDSLILKYYLDCYMMAI